MDKEYIIVAGVNGAGKTTLFQTNDYFFQTPRINLDEIVREFGSWKNTKDISKAGMIAVRKINDYFYNNESFNQETTLCGKSIFRNIDIAIRKGYIVKLYYIGVDSVDIAKKRVHKRVIDGGHGVPDKDIERRYTESLNNLRMVLNKCDKTYIYDNTYDFKRIAIFENDKCVWKAERLPDWFMNWENS